VAGGQEHPALQPVAHLVHLVLDGDHLAGEAGVVVEEGGVRETYRHLREVLHLYEDVHRPLELRELARGLCRGRVRRHRGTRHLPDLGHALRWALHEEHVARAQHVIGLGVEVPLVVRADGDGPHARLRREVRVVEAAAFEPAPGVDADPGGGLLGVRDILQQFSWDTEAFHDDLGDVVGGVADLLDVLDHLEDSGHLLGVRRAAGGEDRQGAHVEDEGVQAFFQAEDLFGDVLGVVEEGGVGQVHHELRGVLRLSEHVFEVARSSVAHVPTPQDRRCSTQL
jgi:hypothetical protein